MAGSLQPRVKTWVTTEDVVFSDLNAEFDNVLLAMQPLLMDDYSTDVTQMQVQTDPGEVGTESKATTLAGELARIRFMLKEITGETNWYESPVSSLTGLSNAIGTGLTANRIVSGRVLTTSAQPAFLVPNGAARTVKVDGTPTNFIYYIDGIEYTISTDVTLTGLTAAPSSNNTCLVDDATLSGQAFTKNLGENGSTITVDNMGTEITALVGKLAAFKTSTEVFLAYVASSTALTKARRGYFFDSSDAALSSVALSNNDTITLLKLTWVFAKTDGTLTATYNNPVWSDDEPTSPSIGDYWFDTSANTWKIYSVGSYSVANAILIGICAQDTTNTIAARSFDKFANYDSLNTLELFAESNSQVKARAIGANINVYGTVYKYDFGLTTWDMTLDLDSGVTEAASTYYYFYITETGDKVISDRRPHDRREDLQGHYHPSQSWRCVGWAFNNASSNLTEVQSFYKSQTNEVVRSAIATDFIDTRDRVVVLSGASFTTYLPPLASMRGQGIKFIHNGTSLSQVYTIDGYGSETINGTSTVAAYTAGEMFHLIPDPLSSTNWLILDHKAATAWAESTLTINGSSSNPSKGTTSFDKFMWRRSGADYLFSGSYRQTVAGSAGSGAYLFPVTSGVTISSSVETNGASTSNMYGTVLGSGSTAGSATGSTSGMNLLVKAWDTGNLMLIESPRLSSAADGQQLRICGGTATGNVSGSMQLGQTNIWFYFEGDFPVSGWLP